MKPESIMIDDVKYVRADSTGATDMDGMPYRIVRTYSAGVFAGYVQSRTGQEVVMRNARRLWYWDGAASLSQLAVDGVNPNKVANCKFSVEVESMEVTQVIEVIPVTAKAAESINAVPIWKQ